MFLLFSSAVFTAPEPYWQKAGQLIQAQDYANAYTELQRLLETRPDDVLLLRLQGVTLIETGHLDAAVSVLGRAAEIDPQSVAVRYYLGQALAYRGNLVEAIRILQQVISMAPESEYARLSQQVLPELQQLASTTDAVSDQKRWNLYLNFGVADDDNVPARADNDPDESPTDSTRYTTSVYVEYRPMDQMVKSNQPVTVGLGYSYYGTWHDRDRFESFDVDSNQISAYVSRSGVWGEKPYTVRVDAGYTDTKLGDEDYSDIYNVGVSVDLQWFKSGVGTLYYTFKEKDFEDDTTDPQRFSRDGDENTVGVRQWFYFLDNRLAVGLSYAYRDEDADGSQFDLESNDFKVSFSATLPFKLRLSGSLDYREEDYVKYTPDPRRVDDVLTYHVALSRPVWKELINLELYYTYTTSNSNLDFSEYDRAIAGVGVSASW